MDPKQQRDNQEAVARDYEKIEALGGPIPCPDKPTPAIWEVHRANE